MYGMDAKLLTAKQVAEACEVSVETVLRWARDGDLQAIRLPRGTVRFRREDIDALLATSPPETAAS